MQKVYLLLRNNQQTGPHSFEDLLQLHLKPFDLIWVEGKSYGWRYPTEVEALKPYLETNPETAQPEIPQNETQRAEATETTPVPRSFNPATPKKIFVSMPVNARPPQPAPGENYIDPIEQKAEELRKRVQAFTPQQESIKTNYTRNLNESEDEYTQWIYEKKKKKGFANKKQLAVAGISALLLLTGLWAGNYFFNNPAVDAQAPAMVNQQNKPEVLPSLIDINTEGSNDADKNFSIPENTTTPVTSLPINKDKNKKQTATKIIEQDQSTTPEPLLAQDEAVQQPVDRIATEPQNEAVAVQPAEKKKTLKEKIAELFKKGKSEEPVVANEGTRGTENSTNERKATRRGEEFETPPVMTDVSDQVTIKTNKIADSWMIGVKNLKLTLYNQSDLTITTAKIEVLYYSEQNNLLDKKTLSFSNIPPKKSQTVAAPDMRLADHIEYKVSSATGVENAYAKQ
jgi:hypothetical protein